MFNLRNILNKLKGRIWHVKGKTYPPERVDELDLSKWGMGDVRPNIEDGGTVVYPTQRPEDPRGGYGGVCIPGDDLPASIPRTGEPPTATINGPNIIRGLRQGPQIDGVTGKSLLVDNDFNFTHLEEVKHDATMRPAAITNGYDRAILLQGPVLALQLQAGETRTINGPVFQRIQNPRKPGGFTIQGHSPVEVLRDMAAERTRAMLRNEPPEKWATDLEFASVDEILKLSKFTVQEL